jgi:hypothetical protein
MGSTQHFNITNTNTPDRIVLPDLNAEVSSILYVFSCSTFELCELLTIAKLPLVAPHDDCKACSCVAGGILSVFDRRALRCSCCIAVRVADSSNIPLNS